MDPLFLCDVVDPSLGRGVTVNASVNDNGIGHDRYSDGRPGGE